MYEFVEAARLEQAHAVLHGGLRAAESPEDGAEYCSGGDVGGYARDVGRLVTRHLHALCVCCRTSSADRLYW